MKNPLLIPFLAILLTIFVVSFISKQEKTTNEKLFREYLRGFKQAKFPLELTAKIATFNPQRVIPKKFNKFLPDDMKTHFMTRVPMRFHNEYAHKLVENDSIVAVVCGSISTPLDTNAKKFLSYTKIMIIYDKKGNILGNYQIASNSRWNYGVANINDSLVCKTLYYEKYKDATKKAEIAELHDFKISPSGKIIGIKQEIYLPSITMKRADFW